MKYGHEYGVGGMREQLGATVEILRRVRLEEGITTTYEDAAAYVENYRSWSRE